MAARTAPAQQLPPAPHIGYAYPAGGRIGSTFTVTVGGQNLNGASNARFSAPGIIAKVTGFERPLTQKEFTDLREKLQALQEKRAAALGLSRPESRAPKGEKAASPEPGKDRAPAASVASDPKAKPTWTDDDQRQLLEFRKQLAKRPNRQGNPAIAESVTLEVTVPPETPAADCQLWLQTPGGLSNPLTLQFNTLPEYVSPVVTATNQPVEIPGQRGDRLDRPETAPTTIPEIIIPTVINGQIMPGKVDRYRFAGRKGQQLTAIVSARALLPYLADAVPGWFQATLALFDPNGHEIAYGDSFAFNPDPIVSFALPGDGIYSIEIKDSIYRGREDFVYRIALGELPVVTSRFPLGGTYPSSIAVQTAGWNLSASGAPPAATPLVSLSSAQQAELELTPCVLEQEPNDTAATAQRLAPPVIVDGRIQKPGDVDVFSFHGSAGQQVVAEVFARRLGSPLDSILTLTDSAGRLLAMNDDFEDKGAGLITHHADSRISVTLPADGVFFLTLADTERSGGLDHAYRLRVGPPRPDFELRVVPSAINARPGAHVPITVYALRHDGFAGEIGMTLKTAPSGFALDGARIPAGKDRVQLTIAVPRAATDGVSPLSLVGTAYIDRQVRRREAVPADDLMQAFAYHHLVPARELLVAVVGKPMPLVQLTTRTPVRLVPGHTTVVGLRAQVPRIIEQITAELSESPEGVTVTSTTFSGALIEVSLACDPAKASPGTTGNLILKLFAERTNAGGPKNAARANRFPLGSTPAMPFEITAEAAP